MLGSPEAFGQLTRGKCPANRNGLRGALVLKARTKYPVRIHSARPFGGDAPFTASDLAKAVYNFNTYQRSGNPAFPNPKSVYLPVPDISIGHEPDQLIAKLLTRTDLPALGKPVNLFMRGPDLFA